MKRSTEQVLRDEIAAAAKVVDAAETRLDRANEAWTMASADVNLRSAELATARARLLRANGALAAFTPPPEELELFDPGELTPVTPAEVPVEGEVS